MKKLYIIILLCTFFSSQAFSKTFASLGAGINLDFNCDKEVIDEIGIIIPKPKIFFALDYFRDENRIGFHVDGNGLFFYKENLLIGLSSLIGPAFLFETKNESGFIISPGVSFGFFLGGSSNDETYKESTMAQGYVGIGCNSKYFFESGFTIGLNLFYYPLMYIYSSVTENQIRNKFDKIENCFSIGIIIGFTDFFK